MPQGRRETDPSTSPSTGSLQQVQGRQGSLRAGDRSQTITRLTLRQALQLAQGSLRAGGLTIDDSSIDGMAKEKKEMREMILRIRSSFPVSPVFPVFPCCYASRITHHASRFTHHASRSAFYTLRQSTEAAGAVATGACLAERSVAMPMAVATLTKRKPVFS